MVLSVRPSVLALVCAAAFALTASAQPPGADPALPDTPGEQKTAPEAAPPSEKTAGDARAAPAAEKKADAPKPVAGWDDMFFLRSADKKFSLRFTGQVQADYRDFLHPNDTTDVDGFTVRRARFGLEAVLFENYEFRILTDFGQNQPRLVDGYLNVRYWDYAQFTAGKFKQPFSYEQLTQDRFTPLVERSLIDQAIPARDAGLMLHGQNLLRGALDYGLSVSNGVRDGDTDTNGAKDGTARVAVRPFAWLAGSPFERLQFGVAVNGGNQSEPINPAVLRTPAGVPFFRFNSGTVADGRRFRWSPEVVYFYRGFGFAAQFFHMDQRVRPAATGAPAAFRADVPFDGYYVQASHLLTGEERTSYSQAVSPLHPFDPRLGLAGLGAWELVGRVSRLRVGDVVFAGGSARLADPAAVSDSATELTLGFNWYLNKWVRAQFNWEHAHFGRPVRLGTGPHGLYRDHDTIQARLQFIF